MLNPLRLKDVRSFASMFLLVLLAVGGTYMLLATAVDRLASRMVETSADQWGRFLGRSPALIRAAVQTAAASPAERIPDVEEYSSDGSAKGQRAPDPAAAAAASANLVVSRPLEQTNRGRNTSVLTTYVPVQVGDAAPSVVKVASDLAPARAVLRQEFLVLFSELSLLIGCSCGVPALAFYWRSRQKRVSDERLTFLARHDTATGLLNRTSFAAVLDRRLQGADEGRNQASVYFIDLDRFKAVNDSLGHSVGDELIKAVAERLSSEAAEDGAVARFGGDEFVLARFCLQPIAEAEAFAFGIRAALAQPFKLGRHQVSISASIGVALAPLHGDDAETILKAADLAMYRAKFDGRDKVRVYTTDMDAELQHRMKVEAALRAALDTETFLLNFQPIFDTQGSELQGFEVLLRLPVSDGEPIQPAIFIPVAEEMGLITRIGEWVLRRACSVASEWPDNLIVAVNLSPKQFEDGRIVEVVADALADSGLAPSRLELEITEGLLMHQTENVIGQLRQLKALGVSIAMDDFGTGYSSLSYLWQFPFDKLKIDRSFMKVLGHKDENTINILKTIVSLGRTLNLQVTAEGIETQDQADLLAGLDCDQLQGYHFGRPMVEEDIAATILRSAAAPARATASPHKEPARKQA